MPGLPSNGSRLRATVQAKARRLGASKFPNFVLQHGSSHRSPADAVALAGWAGTLEAPEPLAFEPLCLWHGAANHSKGGQA